MARDHSTVPGEHVHVRQLLCSSLHTAYLSLSFAGLAFASMRVHMHISEEYSDFTASPSPSSASRIF